VALGGGGGPPPPPRGPPPPPPRPGHRAPGATSVPSRRTRSATSRLRRTW
jgi:hypothetical protein